MSTHSLFSPSSAHRWMSCPGSMAFADETKQGPNPFADSGTASHALASLVLFGGDNCEDHIGSKIRVNGVDYEVDEERAGFTQVYVDDVRRRAMGGVLLVEYRIDTSDFVGKGQGGTGDAVIFQPEERHLIIEDLKYGTGEKVWASQDGEINQQLGLYALGALKDARIFGKIDKVTVVICQPRLYHIDEFTISVEELLSWANRVRQAVRAAGEAMCIATTDSTLKTYLHPGEKQCRWCPAKTTCPALADRIAEEVRMDFEKPEAAPAPLNATALSRAFCALPLIEHWCKAVKAEVHRRVSTGLEVLGPDEKPLKFVEGKEGSRAWSDPKSAEEALLGQLPQDKVYKPKEIITAPAAAKILDKKATEAIWSDVFVPLIKKAKGAPVLVTGSDPRPAFVGAAEAEEFKDDITT